MSTIAQIAALAAFAVVSGSAVAQARVYSEPSYGDQTVSMRVSTADLNLESQAGAQVMLHRIHYAASIVCGFRADDSVLAMSRTYRRCMDDATERAVGKLDNPIVSALNARGQSGQLKFASRAP